jgi:hypothetical protein
MKSFFRICFHLMTVFLLATMASCAAQSPIAAVQMQSPDHGLEDMTPKVTPPPSTDLLFAIYYLSRAGGSGEIQLVTNESVLHSGDHLKIVFTPFEDCCVYIVYIDSTNSVLSLFPMQSFGGVTVDNLNPVQGGKIYYLPAPKKAFVLGCKTGAETIYFLASRQRDLEFEAQYQRVVDAQNEQRLRQIDQLLELMEEKGQGQIAVDASETESLLWDQSSFKTLKRRLDVCEGCVHVLHFEHQD